MRGSAIRPLWLASITLLRGMTVAMSLTCGTRFWGFEAAGGTNRERHSGCGESGTAAKPWLVCVKSCHRAGCIVSFWVHGLTRSPRPAHPPCPGWAAHSARCRLQHHECAPARQQHMAVAAPASCYAKPCRAGNSRSRLHCGRPLQHAHFATCLKPGSSCSSWQHQTGLPGRAAVTYRCWQAGGYTPRCFLLLAALTGVPTVMPQASGNSSVAW